MKAARTISARHALLTDLKVLGQNNPYSSQLQQANLYSQNLLNITTAVAIVNTGATFRVLAQMDAADFHWTLVDHQWIQQCCAAISRVVVSVCGFTAKNLNTTVHCVELRGEFALKKSG
jgi:hypothetical protein